MARRNLTRDEIVREAIALVRDEGVEGLSMRKLAARLKVQAPTLYYYIPDKTALLNEILIDLFHRCLARIPPCDTWQDWMRAYGLAIWDIQQEEKFSPLLILNTQLDEAHFQQTMRWIRTDLGAFPADQEKLFFLQTAVQAVVTGWSVFANAQYSDKVARFIDFREAAMDSVDSLVKSWEPKIQ